MKEGRTMKRFWRLCFLWLAGLSALPAWGDGGATAGAVAGSVFLMGPRVGNHDFIYYTVREQVSDRTGETVVRRYRLDCSAFTFWSRSRYASGLIDEAALNHFLDDYGVTTTSAFKSDGAFGRRPLPGKAWFQDKQVPVIVLSSNPNAVLQAMQAEVHAANEAQTLVNLVGANQTLQQMDIEEKELRGRINALDQTAADVFLDGKRRKEAINQLNDDFRATATLRAAGTLAALLQRIDAQSTATRVAGLVQNQQAVQHCYAQYARTLLAGMGKPVGANLSDAEVLQAAERELK
jgi:hypothetical protein